MTDMKPTPREALSHLCWALTHGENADEDIRVLSAALERLEVLERERLHWLAKSAEELCANAAERDALRAERDALQSSLDGLGARLAGAESTAHGLLLERNALRVKLEEAMTKDACRKCGRYLPKHTKNCFVGAALAACRKEMGAPNA